tara:strand:+ start:131 stop:343 length:213 start_codon:yes stop_codon:yes gene_type:complete
VKYIIIYIIKFYQLTVGLWFRGACRFDPSCSEYMKQAILKYGAFQGLIMGLKRLSRCHPYSKHFGIDEVS